MLRTLVAALTIASLAGGALADVLIVKGRTGKPVILGLKKEIGGIDIDMNTWESFADESDGIITREGYDGIEFAKTSRSKPQFYEQTSIIKARYTTEPDALADAYDQMDAGSYGRAINLFREVAGDQSVREPFRLEANFRIGTCYVTLGKNKSAAAHFAKWPGKNSTYTPLVHRILAELQTNLKRYNAARAEYKKIEALPGITDNWKYQAQLGSVKVAIAERKFGEAESTAKTIANRTMNKPELTDSLALAYVLQGEAILRSDNKDRLPEAERILRRATDLKGVSDANKAYLYTTLGHTQYAQGKLEEARFPYMRVVCLYPGERGFASSSLQNAGQIFLDLAGRAEDPAENDRLFMQGMKLLRECAGSYRGSGAARKAGSTYMANKKRYDDLLAAQKAKGGEEEAGSKGEAGK